MLKKLFVFSGLFFNSCNNHIPKSNRYTYWIKKADSSFYIAKHYQESANAFTQAFAISGGQDLSGNHCDDQYLAACAWAKAGNSDSAFFMLMRIATKDNYTDLNELLIESYLNNLHSGKRWEQLIATVKQNKEKAEAGLDKTLVITLDTIYLDDQGIRNQIGEEIWEKYGANSKEEKDLLEIMKIKDSINLIKINKILDKYGWAGPDVVGVLGNQT